MFAIVVGDLKKSELIIQDLKENGYGVGFIDANAHDYITEVSLKENRIQFSNIFIALTEEDHINLYLCKIAKDIYGVNKTVALANYPDNIELMERQKIDYVICSNLFIKNSIEEFVIEIGGEQ